MNRPPTVIERKPRALQADAVQFGPIRWAARKPRPLATAGGPTPVEPEPVLTFVEAARIAGKHRNTIYKWVISTKLRGTRRANGTRGVREADLRAFLRHLAATERRSLPPKHRPGEQFGLPLEEDDDAP